MSQGRNRTRAGGCPSTRPDPADRQLGVKRRGKGTQVERTARPCTNRACAGSKTSFGSAEANENDGRVLGTKASRRVPFDRLADARQHGVHRRQPLPDATSSSAGGKCRPCRPTRARRRDREFRLVEIRDAETTMRRTMPCGCPRCPRPTAATRTRCGPPAASGVLDLKVLRVEVRPAGPRAGGWPRAPHTGHHGRRTTVCKAVSSVSRLCVNSRPTTRELLNPETSRNASKARSCRARQRAGAG